eukprot:tig00000025_g7953.t1
MAPLTPRRGTRGRERESAAATQRTTKRSRSRSRARALKPVRAAAFLPFLPKSNINLVRFHELKETWLRGNDCILSGHRQQLQPCDCLFSVCCIHNETGNIWTHLLATLLAVGIAIRVLFFDLRGAALEHYLNLASFLISGIGVFLCSFIFHAFMPVSARAFSILSKLDYVGIAVHLFGANLPAINYEFYCEPALWRVYVALFVGASLVMLAAASRASFAAPEYQWLRGALFFGCGVAFIAPHVHKIVAFGTGHEETDRALPFYILSGVFYGVGTVIFALRFPERLWPGRFDYWLHSHQLFHVLCVPGYLAFLAGVHSAWRWRSTTECTHALPRGLLHDLHDLFPSIF